MCIECMSLLHGMGCIPESPAFITMLILGGLHFSLIGLVTNHFMGLNFIYSVGWPVPMQNWFMLASGIPMLLRHYNIILLPILLLIAVLFLKEIIDSRHLKYVSTLTLILANLCLIYFTFRSQLDYSVCFRNPILHIIIYVSSRRLNLLFHCYGWETCHLW